MLEKFYEAFQKGKRYAELRKENWENNVHGDYLILTGPSLFPKKEYVKPKKPFNFGDYCENIEEKSLWEDAPPELLKLGEEFKKMNCIEKALFKLGNEEYY